MEQGLDPLYQIYALRTFLLWRYTPCASPNLGRIAALSYQLNFVNFALRKYYEQGAVRLLLADDVGLGKTIMTGLLLKELMVRGVIRRILLLVPKMLKFQWRRELAEKFDIRCEERPDADCAVLSLDWAKRHVSELLARSWDFLVVDEAHNLTAPRGRETTQRYEAAAKLASVVRNVLLLSATPHHGDKRDFIMRLRLLDKSVDETTLKKAVGEYVVRRLREEVRDEVNIPERHVAPPVEIELSPPEAEFYRGITDYVLYYYKLAQSHKALGLVAVVFQKRASSSLYAAVRTLERRREALLKCSENPTLCRPSTRALKRELDVIEKYMLPDPKLIQDELKRVEELLKLSNSITIDSKLEKLKEILERHRGDKAIVFTQYRDTMRYIADRLKAHGWRVVELHGGMDEEERKRAEREFKEEGEVLVATDAASEGLNLQVANILINFDLPWNPSRLDQRIGRVHRYGQRKPVFVYNFLVKDTIDGKIYEVLLRKIDDVRRDLGKVFDYLGNVMDARTFAKIVEEAARGKDPVERVETVIKSKATLKDIEELLTRDRIQLEADPRCRDYLTDEELRGLILSTLSALDPRSYEERGDCIKVRYIPRQLRCSGTCITDWAGFGLSHRCRESITPDHPLVQAVIQYHLSSLPYHLEVEVERPCFTSGTTWVYKATATLRLPVSIDGREMEYELAIADAYFAPKDVPSGCSATAHDVDLNVLTLPVLAIPQQADPPPMPPEVITQVKERMKESVNAICEKVKNSILAEITSKSRELEKKKLLSEIEKRKELEKLRNLWWSLYSEIDRRCDAVEPKVDVLTALTHRPLGYSVLGLNGAKAIIEQGRTGEAVVKKLLEEEGCHVYDLRDIPMAGVDYVALCPSETKFIEVKSVVGPRSNVYITQIEWQTLCASKDSVMRKFSRYIDSDYRRRVKNYMYLYIVDIQEKAVRIYQNPCDMLRSIVQRYESQQVKYVIPYSELLNIAPAEVRRYD